MMSGYREVARKRLARCEQRRAGGAVFLGRHMIPVVAGRSEHCHLIDDHHQARTLFEEGVHRILARIAEPASTARQAPLPDISRCGVPWHD